MSRTGGPNRHGTAYRGAANRRLAVMLAVCLTGVLTILGRQVESGDCPVEGPLTLLQIGAARLIVEVADTNAARRCGLARRDHLPADRGMLFVYPDSRILEFWMQDTRIPLALAYIDERRRIIEILQLTPQMGDQRVASSQPARFALETNPGWFAANGIATGDRVDFELAADRKIE